MARPLPEQLADHRMNHQLLLERMHARGLSLWELGDVLGIHPRHHLHKVDAAGGLVNQPVRVLIEQARRPPYAGAGRRPPV